MFVWVYCVVDFVQEIFFQCVQVVCCVYVDQVVGGQCFEQCLVLWQIDQQVGGWQWCVQEEVDVVFYFVFVQESGQWDQVVIVYLDYVVGFEQFDQVIGKQCIDLQIVVQMVVLVVYQVGLVMQQWLQCVIGEVGVEFVVVGVGEVDGGVVDCFVLGVLYV